MTKNKIPTLMLFLFLLIFLVGASTAMAPPGVLYVDDMDDGIGGNFSTIQEAVDSADEYNNTILVYPGTYAENVDVNKELTIQSVSGDPEDTILNASGSDHAFDVSANNVSISGFKINISTDSNIAAIKISARNDTVLNNIISGNNNLNRYGIYLTSTSLNNKILNNTISEFYYGTYLYRSDENELRNNTVSECDNCGVCIYNSEGNELRNNIMANNEHNFWANGKKLNNDIDTSNYVDGKPIYYLVNESDISGDYFFNAGTIYLINCSNVTVRDQTLENNYYGIFLSNTKNSTMNNNRISSNHQGIYLYYSEGNELGNNTISECNLGILLYSSEESELRNNTISECDNCGVSICNSEGSELRNNIMANNEYNFYADGYKLNTDIDTSNYVDGKPIYYLINESDISAEYFSNAGTIYLINCSNVTVRDQVLENNYRGIFLFNTDNSTVINNNLSLNRYGINFENSKDNDLIENDVFNNNGIGINLRYSDNNTIIGNNASLNDIGIRLSKSQFNTVRNNVANANDCPGIVLCYADNNTVTSNMVLDGDAKGINVHESSYNTLTGNIVNNNRMGLHLYESSYNNVTDNVITYSRCVGLKIEGCYNNLTDNNVSFNKGSGIVISDDDSHNTIIENNVVNDNNCNGIRIKGSKNHIAGNIVCNNEDWGIFAGTCDGSSNNTVIKNDVRNNYMGIVFKNLYDSEMTGNTVTDNGIIGISLSGSENLTLQSNIVKSNGYLEEKTRLPKSLLVNSDEEEECSKSSEGPDIVMASHPMVSSGMGPEGAAIYLEDSGENYLISNAAKSNGYLEEGDYYMEASGVNSDEEEECSKSSEGPDIVMASNPVVGKSMDSKRAGIFLEDSSENYLISNIVENNSDSGLCLIDSFGNTIYDNYFNNINNTRFTDEFLVKALEGDEEETNIWNTTLTEGTNIIGGSYLGGNFWALPNGTGFSQTVMDTDGDGICDSAYKITENAEDIDYFPLTNVKRSETEPETVSSSSPNYIPAPMSGSTGNIDAVQKRVSAGTPTKVELKDPKNDVFGIGFESKQYSGTVIVRVGESDGNEADNAGKLGGKVYKQMNIQLGNDKFESSDNINGAYIEFRVSKSWVEENGIDPATIAMNRYHDETWNSLSTEMTGEDDEFYTFRAETPGFSLYAITGEEKGTGASAVTKAITPDEGEGTETILDEEQRKDEGSESAPGFGTIFAVLGILGSAFFARKEMFK